MAFSLASGEPLPPLPTPPFYEIPNVNNFRDAALHNGGITTEKGQKLKPGILFRSAEVSRLDREGWTKVRDIGVGHVFDLRSKPEVEKGWKGITGDEGDNRHDPRAGWQANLESVGVDRTWVPVFAEKDYSPERLAERYMKYMSDSNEGFVQAYRDILHEAGPAFRTIFQYLANLPDASQNSPQGALIHCTAGKDRTGICIGILFSYLGVPSADIASEYQLTELGLGHIRDEIVARLMQSPGFKQYTMSQVNGNALEGKDFVDVVFKEGRMQDDELVVIPEEAMEKGRQAALRMMSARVEAMLGVLEMVEQEWGNAEGYLKTVVGLNDAELEGLKKNLLV